MARISDLVRNVQRDRDAPVDEDVVESELENEGLELLLDLKIRLLVRFLWVDVKRCYTPAIHFGSEMRCCMPESYRLKERKKKCCGRREEEVGNYDGQVPLDAKFGDRRAGRRGCDARSIKLLQGQPLSFVSSRFPGRCSRCSR